MTGFTLVTASRIQDGSGHPLISGRVTFTPVNNWGESVSAIAATAAGGGLILCRPVVFLVVNGAITTDLYNNPPQIADTSLTTPANICYRVTVMDETGAEVEGPGYTMVQPSGASFSLDTYSPNQPQLATIQTGPPGPPGTVGTTGGTAGITLIDTATGQSFVLTIAYGEVTLSPS